MNILEHYQTQQIEHNVPGTAVEYIAFQLARRSGDFINLPSYLIETDRDWRVALKRFAERRPRSAPDSRGYPRPNHST